MSHVTPVGAAQLLAKVGIFHILAEDVCGKDLSLEEFLELGGLDQRGAGCLATHS